MCGSGGLRVRSSHPVREGSDRVPSRPGKMLALRLRAHMHVFELGGWVLEIRDICSSYQGEDGWTCTVDGSRGMSEGEGVGLGDYVHRRRPVPGRSDANSSVALVCNDRDGSRSTGVRWTPLYTCSGRRVMENQIQVFGALLLRCWRGLRLWLMT
jgi:hypothetical protein